MEQTSAPAPIQTNPAPIPQPGGAEATKSAADRTREAMAVIAAKRAENAAKAKAAPVEAPGADRDEDDGPTFDTPTARREPLPNRGDLAAAPEADDAEPEESLSAVIRAREKANRIRREAEAHRAQLDRERATLEAQRRELERYSKAAQAQSPAEALRALGLDPRAVLEDTALEGTPEHTIRQLQARLEQQERALQEYQRTQQEAVAQRARADAEQTFAKVAADEERFPYLAARAATHPQLVMRQAYELQSAYHAKTGQYPTLEMIAEGLDAIEQEGYRAIYERQTRRGTSTAAAPATAPAADKRHRTPTKTLSSARSGERSVAEPDPRTLTRDERARIAAEKLRRARAAAGR